jgi:hypothetical protein
MQHWARLFSLIKPLTGSIFSASTMPGFISKLALPSFFLPTDVLAQQSFPWIGRNTLKNIVVVRGTKNNN